LSELFSCLTGVQLHNQAPRYLVDLCQSVSSVASRQQRMFVVGLHNQAPRYLVDLCQSVSSVASRQHLRSASRGLLVVPCHRLSSDGRRAFSLAGPVIWNWLPDSLRDPAISRDSFKRSLNTFLFSAYSCT